MSNTETKLRWRRVDPVHSADGYYADGAEYRYTVRRHQNRRWHLQVWRTTEVAGVRVRVPGPAVDYSMDDTLALARAVAEAHAVEPDQHEIRQNRMTRAVGRAYSA